MEENSKQESKRVEPPRARQLKPAFLVASFRREAGRNRSLSRAVVSFSVGVEGSIDQQESGSRVPGTLPNLPILHLALPSQVGVLPVFALACQQNGATAIDTHESLTVEYG